MRLPVESQRLQAEQLDDSLDPPNGCPPMSEDEKGLALWGGVDLDLTVQTLKLKRCAVCGAPATTATRRLDQQERRFLCDQHRTT
jgi:hypothetical protein